MERSSQLRRDGHKAPVWDGKENRGQPEGDLGEAEDLATECKLQFNEDKTEAVFHRTRENYGAGAENLQ